MRYYECNYFLTHKKVNEKYFYYIPVVLGIKVVVVYELSVLSGLVSRQCRLRTNCVTPGA